jgi:hypothetical protein
VQGHLVSPALPEADFRAWWAKHALKR